jgi:carboxylesterase type B
MSHWNRLIALGAAFLLLGPMPKGTVNLMRIDSGSISGATEKSGVTAYPSIPFASPPVGQLLRHRRKGVWFRTSGKSQLQALAMGQGIRPIFRLNNLEAR